MKITNNGGHLTLVYSHDHYICIKCDVCYHIRRFCKAIFKATFKL